MARIAILTPPLLLLISGLGMAAVAPFAWGAGSGADLPDWMPAVSGALFALPAVWVGLSTVRESLRRMSGGFSVFHLQLACGLFLFFILALVEVALTARIADPATYDSLRNGDDSLKTTPLSFFLVTLVSTAFASAWLSVGAYLYGQGITSEKAMRFERAWDEPDVMEDFLRGQRPQR
jgi:hypothetical protein